jgi:hypothetical protein
VALVSGLQVGSLPISAQDHASAVDHATTTVHCKALSTGECPVVSGCLITCSRRATHGKFVRSDEPQVGIATVIAEVNRHCWRQHQVGVLVHGDRVDVHRCRQRDRPRMRRSSSADDTRRPPRRMITVPRETSSVKNSPLPSIGDSDTFSRSSAHTSGPGSTRRFIAPFSSARWVTPGDWSTLRLVSRVGNGSLQARGHPARPRRGRRGMRG